MEFNTFFPQTEATTFAFSSVFNLNIGLYISAIRVGWKSENKNNITNYQQNPSYSETRRIIILAGGV